MNTDKNSSSTFPTSRTKTVYGSHVFKITGYSLNKGWGIKKYVKSNNFFVGGYEWTIRFYTDGYNIEDNASHVSVYVALESEAINVRANLELTLVDQSGKNKHRVVSGPNSFETQESIWGCSRFLKRSLLDSSDYIKDDSLLIRCCMDVVIDSQTELQAPKISPSNISQHFGQILESGEGSDIKFEVDGEIFVAHKLILGVRSPLFKAQLLGPMKHDNTKECIEIVDMKATVFKALLHFIYYDALPLDLDLDSDHLFAQHLLEAADRYGLERLRSICEAKLCEGITIDTVATTLVVAEQHHCSQLTSICFQFIAENLNNFRHLQ